MSIQQDKNLRVLTGNGAAAYSVMLCRPDVISAYPITPQTELLDVLYRLHADGMIAGELVDPESEHSVMSIVVGASSAGGRTFCSTASQGLFYMFEPYISAATQRLPIVMVNANREIQPPGSVAGSGQDIVIVKDAGWIQLHTESCQEIMDTIIMAYKLAEDSDILAPVTIAYDGYYLSYFAEAVDIPDQQKVDGFIPNIRRTPRIDPDMPMAIGLGATPEMCLEYRVRHMEAMQRAKAKLDTIDGEFNKVFGRSYGGQIEEYRCDDADIVLMTMGSCTGTAKVVVDRKRDQGLKVGLVKVRMFRPFPQERLLDVLGNKQAVGVIDRNVCFGWYCGHLFMELRAAMNTLDNRIPLVNFIGGLNGGDITLDDMARAVDITHLAAQGKPHQEVTFLDIE